MTATLAPQNCRIPCFAPQYDSRLTTSALSAHRSQQQQRQQQQPRCCQAIFGLRPKWNGQSARSTTGRDGCSSSSTGIGGSTGVRWSTVAVRNDGHICALHAVPPRATTTNTAPRRPVAISPPLLPPPTPLLLQLPFAGGGDDGPAPKRYVTRGGAAGLGACSTGLARARGGRESGSRCHCRCARRGATTDDDVRNSNRYLRRPDAGCPARDGWTAQSGCAGLAHGCRRSEGRVTCAHATKRNEKRVRFGRCAAERTQTVGPMSRAASAAAAASWKHRRNAHAELMETTVVDKTLAIDPTVDCVAVVEL